MGKKLKSLVILLVGLAFVYWFARQIDWPKVIQYWQHAHWWMILVGGVLINATLIVRSLRWQVFLAPVGRAEIGDILAATVIGFGCQFVAGRPGEVVRPIVLSLRTRLHPSATIATILIERICDMSAVALMFAVTLLTISLADKSPQEIAWMHPVGWMLLLGVAIGISLVGLLRWRAALVIDLIGSWFSWLPRKLVGFVQGFLSHLAESLSVLTNALGVFKVISYTAVTWGMIGLAYWFVAQAFDLNFSVSQVAFVLGAGLVGSLVPTPGGSAGAFHVAAAKGLTFLGVGQDLAASAAIAIHIVSFGSPFIFALFYLMRDEIKLGQLREVMAGEPTVTAKQV